MEVTFERHDDYPMLRVKFHSAWPNLDLEMHHSSTKLDKEGFDEFDSDAVWGDPNSPNEVVFTLTDETTVGTAQRLFSQHFPSTAFILRNGVSVDLHKSLADSNAPT